MRKGRRGGLLWDMCVWVIGIIGERGTSEGSGNGNGNGMGMDSLMLNG